MKISFLTERLLPGLGVDTVVAELARGMAKKGHDVRVIASQIHPMFTEDTEYQVIPIKIPYSRRLPVHQRAALREIRRLLASGELRMDADEIFVLATEPFYPLARTVQRSAILYFGNSPPLGLGWKAHLNYAYAVISQNFYSLPPAAIVLPCSFFLRRLLPRGIRRKSVVLYPGVDHYDRWAPNDEDVVRFRASLGVEEKDTVLFYAGRLNHEYQPYKGLEELVSHFRAIKAGGRRVHLFVAGFGDERDEVRLREQGVIVFRNAPRSMMPLLFKACDIYLTASRWEGFDLPLAEAQHYGKPVLAYNTGAHPEILYPYDSGYLVENKAALRSTLEFMLDNPLWCREMGSRGRDRVARFRWRFAVEQFETCLKSIAGGL